jgi:hypothetical protein
MKWLRLHDLVGLNKVDIANIVRHQLHEQFYDIQQLRYKKRSVIHAFEVISQKYNTPFKDIKEVNEFKITSSQYINKSFDELILDGRRFGNSKLGNNLTPQLNILCEHCISAQMYMSLLNSEDDNIANKINTTAYIPLVVEDVRALSIEKFGTSPDIAINGDCNITAVTPLIKYILVEILKNSISAILNKYTPLNVDDAPPVLITCYPNEVKDIEKSLKDTSKFIGDITIDIIDNGNGMSSEVLNRQV